MARTLGFPLAVATSLVRRCRPHPSKLSAGPCPPAGSSPGAEAPLAVREEGHLIASQMLHLHTRVAALEAFDAPSSIDTLSHNMNTIAHISEIHNLRIISHVDNLHTEIVDCENLIVAMGGPSRHGPRLPRPAPAPDFVLQSLADVGMSVAALGARLASLEQPTTAATSAPKTTSLKAAEHSNIRTVIDNFSASDEDHVTSPGLQDSDITSRLLDSGLPVNPMELNVSTHDAPLAAAIAKALAPAMPNLPVDLTPTISSLLSRAAEYNYQPGVVHSPAMLAVFGKLASELEPHVRRQLASPAHAPAPGPTHSEVVPHPSIGERALGHVGFEWDPDYGELIEWVSGDAHPAPRACDTPSSSSHLGLPLLPTQRASPYDRSFPNSSDDEPLL